MITEVVFDLLKALILKIIDRLPDFRPLDELLGSYAGLVEIIAKSSYFVPWNAVLLCLASVVLFYNIQFTVSLFNWLIAKIPTID